MEDPSAKEALILVDSQDRQIGSQPKAECHRHPLTLHRAFSVFLFDQDGRMLITQRSKKKTTWPGFWSNACCSHPREGESTEEAAHRRLKEEMGFDTTLSEAFDFIYKAEFDNGLTEWEFDHVFIGNYDGEVEPDPEEVGGFEWVDPLELKEDIKNNPEKFTPWFKLALEYVL